MKDQGIRSNMWRWWAGGGVIGIAVVLGCATAVDFKKSGREAGAVPVVQKTKMSGEAKPAREPAHNGGKIALPVVITFDDEQSIKTISGERDVVIWVRADDRVKPVQGIVEGEAGLAGVEASIVFDTSPDDGSPEIRAGKVYEVRVHVPAKSGSLIVRIMGHVAGRGELPANQELKLVNLDDPRPAAVSSKASIGEFGSAVQQDATGRMVESMPATEE